MSTFPELVDLRALRFAIDDSFNWLVIHYGDVFEALFRPLLRFLTGFENFLNGLPWWGIFILVIVLGYAASRSIRMVIASTLMLFCIGLLGAWTEALATIALMLTATFISIMIGIPVGIIMSRFDRLRAILLPILDIMQTMPIFVYLIPFVMLLGPGKIPALLATVFFAVAPSIRLTDLGIRQVDKDVVEASEAFGATGRQTLIHVQIPLALPSIMTGINQTTMMALSMVVIASMIGAGGLGYQVLQGIQRLEVSRGLLAGIAIVLVALIFDRFSQILGRQAQNHLNHENN